MKAKTASLTLGLLLVGNLETAVAVDYANICGSNIAGVHLAMSKTEVQSTLASSGYKKVIDSDDKKKKPNRQSMQSLLFQTPDRQPNADFINSVSWQHTLSTGRNKIFATYVAPSEPDRLEAYEAFWRSKLTSYCAQEIDALRATASGQIASRMNPNPMSPTHKFCENALKGEFRTTVIGHAHTPPNPLYITDAQGCRVSYGNVNLRGVTSAFTISIEHTR